MTTVLPKERRGLGVPSKEQAKELQNAVLGWFAANGRDFPWRKTSNSFHLLIAEVLLRQTQAERIVCPYLELVGIYPDPQALVGADVHELRRWFKPLGLVKRADRLVQTAQILVDTYAGQVPNDLKALMALPGLGIYSTRAVLCLGFGVPTPMIDEGSGRVLRRVTGLAPKGAAYSDTMLLQMAEGILPKESCREFNLGLIDISAVYCRVNTPKCAECPIYTLCSFVEKGYTAGAECMHQMTNN